MVPKHTFPNGKRWITDELGVQWRLIHGSRQSMRIKAHGDPINSGGYHCNTPEEGVTELLDGGYIDEVTAIEFCVVKE